MGENTQQPALVLVPDYSIKGALQEEAEGVFPLPCCLTAWSQGNRPKIDGGSKATHSPTNNHYRSSKPSTKRTNKWRALKRKALDHESQTTESIKQGNVSSKRLHVDVAASEFRVSRTVWVGVRCSNEEKIIDGEKPIALGDLLRDHPQLSLVEWDGRHAMKIIDKEDRIIVHLGGKPDQKSFDSSMTTLANEMTSACIAAGIPETLPQGHGGNRGDHPSGTYGYTYPGGKDRPSLLKNGCEKAHGVAVQLGASRAAQRIKGLQASMMRTAAPAMYRLYCETDRIVRQNSPDLESDLQGTIPSLDPPGHYPFASVTYNFGLQTVCSRHRDCMNFGPGWCAVTALGNYNPKRGGHIVLWELNLVIEFPPGATILLPSALITHFNTSIGPDETRMSVVRYTAGGLFGWVANGCRSKSQRKCPAVTHSINSYLDLYMTVSELDGQCEMFAD